MALRSDLESQFRHWIVIHPHLGCTLHNWEDKGLNFNCYISISLSLFLSSPQACSGVLLVCFSASNGEIEGPPQLTLCNLGSHLKSTATDPQGETKRYGLLCGYHCLYTEVADIT